MVSKVAETLNVQDAVEVETFFGLQSAVIDEWLAGKCENQSHVLFFYDMREAEPENKKPPPPGVEVKYVPPEIHISTSAFLRVCCDLSASVPRSSFVFGMVLHSSSSSSSSSSSPLPI
jgi:hypothetical protein